MLSPSLGLPLWQGHGAQERMPWRWHEGCTLFCGGWWQEVTLNACVESCFWLAVVQPSAYMSGTSVKFRRSSPTRPKRRRLASQGWRRCWRPGFRPGHCNICVCFPCARGLLVGRLVWELSGSHLNSLDLITVWPWRGSQALPLATTDSETWAAALDILPSSCGSMLRSREL